VQSPRASEIQPKKSTASAAAVPKPPVDSWVQIQAASLSQPMPTRSVLPSPFVSAPAQAQRAGRIVADKLAQISAARS
jgi:hypothetical protein